MEPAADARDTTDNEIITRVAQGDSLAFRHLVQRYYSPLLTYLTYAVGERDAAEDLLQEVFLRTWSARATLPRDGNLRLYLYAAARNAVLNHARSRQRAERRTTAYAQTDDGASATADVLADLEHEELTRSVHEAIATLPDRAREVFQLHREQGLTYQEIATLLGISVNTVKFHLGRATQLLRAAIGPLLSLVLMHRS